MFKGAAEAAYPALVFGNDSERTHLRLCHDCFATFLEECQERLTRVVYGAKAPGKPTEVCCMCGGAPGRTKLFVTAYPKGEEEQQFFGAVCDADVGAARVAWLGPDIAS
jgi:hypothetical protein